MAEIIRPHQEHIVRLLEVADNNQGGDKFKIRNRAFGDAVRQGMGLTDDELWEKIDRIDKKIYSGVVDIHSDDRERLVGRMRGLMTVLGEEQVIRRMNPHLEQK